MSELLPCPFCGGPASFIPSRLNSPEHVYAGCNPCDAFAPDVPDTREAQAAAWNSRAANPPASPDSSELEALRTDLQRALDLLDTDDSKFGNGKCRYCCAEVGAEHTDNHCPIAVVATALARLDTLRAAKGGAK